MTSNNGTIKSLFTKMSSKINDERYEQQQSSSPPSKKTKTNKSGQAIEDIYQKKTQLEHILLRPDTYIGSVEPVMEQMWIIDEGKMLQKQITYVPGLYKIFDEILVNAADNKQRDTSMDLIKIDIDQENNSICIHNNGIGIPVEMHKIEKMYVPSMIFGHLLTSSNFNDDDKKVTGGRNGYGAKLCNVFSTKFIVETGHKDSKRAFKQTWENNMQKTSEPKIREFTGHDYTKITFYPDLTKFNMTTLDNDIISIFHRRAFDIAASTNGVKVNLNGKKLPVKGFKDYVDLFLKDKLDENGTPLKFNYEAVNDRWEIAVAPSENGFQQNSFVNSIATTKGGRHVDYISDLIVKNLVEIIKKKNKNGIDIKPFQIRNHLWIFINCLIENPTFDSQTKENMTLQAKSFGSKCMPSEKFYNGVIKSGIVENVLSWAKFKAENLLNKNCAGRKQIKIKGIPKLEDANDAGTKLSVGCTLILTEGDSAKTLAVSGLAVIGRDKFGVFPLRGKLLNVREATHKQIMENAEINALVKILGLQYKRKYITIDDMKTLRYGKIMIMTDQDHDGSHIKGLIINFIHHNWPTLLQMNFIEEFITPIVKASKGKNEIHSFFSMPELDEWKKTKSKSELKGYTIKYYKGLGTSTGKEAKEYFSDMQRHRIKFKYLGNKDDEQITMAFSRKCIEQRKDWLTGWMEGCKRKRELGLNEDIIYSSNIHTITFTDFVNKELVLFSNLDNERSIPCLVDGLKPGQRKVLYACFKRVKKGEVKVAQLAGSIAEISAYHHGEVSLMSTIVNLAQNFVGSNNINLLQPIGQFGTRLQGGKDSASPRYIFTMISQLTRIIFDIRDDAILTNLYDDNMMIEPEYYCPIIPMILINGADGIGTGWMTRLPNFNPREIIINLKRLIKGNNDLIKLKPWYKNFHGDIIEINQQKYAVNGEMKILNNEQIEINELPIGIWTNNYKENILDLMQNGNEKIISTIIDYKDYSTDTSVKFIINIKNEQLKKYQTDGLHKSFKLQTSINLTSMVLFDQNGCLKKYENVEEILMEFYQLRYKMYIKRKEYLLAAITAECEKLTNQARFIMEKCDGQLIVENKKKDLLINELINKKYDSDPIKQWRNKYKLIINDDDDTVPTAVVIEDGKDFDYLLGMSIWCLTLEKKEELLKRKNEKLIELNILKCKTPADMYDEDLTHLSNELDRVEKEEEFDLNENLKNKNVNNKKGLNKQKMDKMIQPSPIGQRVIPVLDDIIKKAAEANKVVKKKKGGVEKTKKKEEIEKKKMVENDDEYDLMITDESLLDKLNNTIDGGKNDIVKKMKQTKLDFGKKKMVEKMTTKKKQNKKMILNDSDDITTTTDDEEEEEEDEMDKFSNDDNQLDNIKNIDKFQSLFDKLNGEEEGDEIVEVVKEIKKKKEVVVNRGGGGKKKIIEKKQKKIVDEIEEEEEEKKKKKKMIKKYISSDDEDIFELSNDSDYQPRSRNIRGDGKIVKKYTFDDDDEEDDD